MYFEIGSPLKLSELTLTCPELRELKQRNKIAIIDDKRFLMADAIKRHGFSVDELGGDITSIDQVMAYPIVICDIKGVGKYFGSSYEGAHVLAEIRKAYPDKYLISFSGNSFDVSYNESLNSADTSATKDADIDSWVRILETGLKAVGDPKERWLRFRKTLVEKGIDAYDLFKLEEAFVKSIKEGRPGAMSSLAVPDEVKELVKAFASVALTQIIDSIKN
jgi:hypothetical protein